MSTIHSKALVPIRQPNAFAGKAKYAASQAASKAGWQATQLPKYTWRTLVHAGRGLTYSTPPVFAFVFQTARHTDAKLVRQMGRGDKAAEISKSAWYWTGAFSIGTALAVTIVLRLIYKHAGYAGLVGLGALLLLVLAFIGSRVVGEKITEKAPPRRADLTSERIDDALQAIGILKTPKRDGTDYGSHVQIHGMPHKHNGGTAVTFDLPPGAKATASTVMANRELLAGQLGVDERQLVIKQGSSAAQVNLWMAEGDPLAAGINPSPYIEEKRTSIWEGVRLGLDPMGEPVVIELIRNSANLGGLPQVGKSSVARNVGAAAALDPYCDVVVFDGKGGADWKAMKQFASRFVNGTSEKALPEMMATVQDLVRQMDARYEILEKAGLEDAPDGRITPALAEKHGLRPLVLFVDELQDILGAFGDKATEYVQALTRLSRRGPAAGIVVFTISHRPDAKSVPKELTGAQPTKIACRTDDRTASDLILGEGSNARGWNASKLPEIEGVGIVRTQTFTTEAKFDYISLQQFEEICRRGMQLRAAANTLRDERDLGVDTIIDDVIVVLTEQGDLTPTDLAAQLGMSVKDMSPRLSKAGLKSRVTDTRRYHLTDARSTLG